MTTAPMVDLLNEAVAEHERTIVDALDVRVTAAMRDRHDLRHTPDTPARRAKIDRLTGYIAGLQAAISYITDDSEGGD